MTQQEQSQLFVKNFPMEWHGPNSYFYSTLQDTCDQYYFEFIPRQLWTQHILHHNITCTYISSQLPYRTCGVSGSCNEMVSTASLVQSHARHHIWWRRRRRRRRKTQSYVKVKLFNRRNIMSADKLFSVSRRRENLEHNQFEIPHILLHSWTRSQPRNVQSLITEMMKVLFLTTPLGKKLILPMFWLDALIPRATEREPSSLHVYRSKISLHSHHLTDLVEVSCMETIIISLCGHVSN